MRTILTEFYLNVIMQSGMLISSSPSGTVWYALTQKIWAVAGYTFCTYNFYYICDSTFFFAHSKWYIIFYSECSANWFGQIHKFAKWCKKRWLNLACNWNHFAYSNSEHSLSNLNTPSSVMMGSFVLDNTEMLNH